MRAATSSPPLSRRRTVASERPQPSRAWVCTLTRWFSARAMSACRACAPPLWQLSGASTPCRRSFRARPPASGRTQSVSPSVTHVTVPCQTSARAQVAASSRKAAARKRQEERARQKHHGVRRAMKTCAANNAPALSEAMKRLRPLTHIRAAPFETLFKGLFAICPWAQTARTRVGCGVANASPGCKTRLRFAPDSSSRFPILCSSRPDHEQVLTTRHAPPRRQWPSDWLLLHQKQKQI